MKSLILMLFLSCSAMLYGQKSESRSEGRPLTDKDILRQALVNSDWKLVNAETYPYSINAANSHGFNVEEDSILRMKYCYIDYYFKITLVNSDSLILKELIQGDLGSDLIFVKTTCTKANNQYNNPKYLSFKYRDYELVVNDDLGIKASILDAHFTDVELTKKSQIELDNFILNNRHNDTHLDFIIIETVNGRFGVVSAPEKVCIRPVYKSIIIENDKIEMRNGSKYALPVQLTNMQGNSINHLIYY